MIPNRTKNRRRRQPPKTVVAGDPPRRRRRWGLAITAIIALIPLSIVALYGLVGLWGEWCWSREKVALKSAGEPITLADLVPVKPDPALNFFDAPLFVDLSRQVFKFPAKGADPSRGRLTDLDALAASRGTGEGEPLAAADVALAAMAGARADVGLLNEALARPQTARVYDWKQLIGHQLGGFDVALRAGQFLASRAAAESAAGRGDLAQADIGVIFALAGRYAQEPLLVSQLVSASLLRLAVGGIWEGIEYHAWSDAQLADWIARLDGIDSARQLALGLRGERAFFNDLNDALQQPGGFPEFARLSNATSASEQGFFASMGAYYPRGFLLADRARHNARVQGLIADLDRGIFPPADTGIIARPDLPPGIDPHWFDRMASPIFLGSVERFRELAALVEQARIACALERYRERNGGYPGSLAALAPDFLKAVPPDPADGKPMRYAAVPPDGFRLWSVGSDRVDGGGKVGEKRGEGDWVWRKIESPISGNHEGDAPQGPGMEGGKEDSGLQDEAEH